MSQPTSREGTMFGHYRLDRLLGRGGMGEVYEAEDTLKGRIVALKLLPEYASHDPVFRKRLLREAHSAGRLQEPHVVPIHDYGEIEGVLFVDMRMINGSDLRKLLTNFGPMTPARAVAILRQVASALDAAHESGVMHRDVKPENILLNRDDFAYLVDFGIASATSDENLTDFGTAVGTYAYMAPERFTDDEITFRADIYALACVLYECLAGAQPFTGNSVSVVITAHLMKPIPRPSVDRPGIPASFDEVIARGMAKRPEDRFATAGDLATAATHALTAREQDEAASILRHTGDGSSDPLAPPMSQPSHPVPYPPPSGHPPPQFAGGWPPTPVGQGRYGSVGGPPPVGGGRPWGAPPPPAPPPNGARPRARRVPWLPIAAVAGVLVLVAAGVGIVLATGSDDEAAGGDPTSSTTASSAGGMSRTSTSRAKISPASSGDEKLLALIPGGYPPSACQRIDPIRGAVASMNCGQSTQPGGPSLARFALFPDADSMNAAFDQAVEADEQVLPCPGVTATSPTAWHYTATPDTPAGRIACGTYDGKADVTYTQDADLMLGVVESNDLDALQGWWVKFG